MRPIKQALLDSGRVISLAYATSLVKDAIVRVDGEIVRDLDFDVSDSTEITIGKRIKIDLDTLYGENDHDTHGDILTGKKTVTL